MVVRQFFSCIVILFTVLVYSNYETDFDSLVKHVGLVCCCTTILFFAAPFASLIHVVRAKSAESLPFPIIVMTLVVSSQWFVYGLLLNDYYIQVFLEFFCLVEFRSDCDVFSGTERSRMLFVEHSAVAVLYLSEQGDTFGDL